MISALLERYNPLRGSGPLRGARSAPKVDPKLNHTYLALHQVQRNHSFVEVSIPGDDVVYQSMILDLDPEERTVLIDELFPRGFVGLSGQRVDIVIRQQGGRKLTFRSEILEKHEHKDAPIYVIKMPEDLAADQRRGAYRLPVGNGVSIASRFTGPDRQTYQGQLRNLSTSGLALELSGEEASAFNYNDRLQHLQFDFAGASFDCGVAVRNVDVDEAEDNRVVIGAEFLDLPPMEKRVLERAITRVQRDRIRHAGDMESQLSMS